MLFESCQDAFVAYRVAALIDDRAFALVAEGCFWDNMREFSSRKAHDDRAVDTEMSSKLWNISKY